MTANVEKIEKWSKAICGLGYNYKIIGQVHFSINAQLYIFEIFGENIPQRRDI